MTKIDRQKIRWSIESFEFSHRGFTPYSGSKVRVVKLTVSEKQGFAKADIEVSAGGVSTIVKGITYILAGLDTWVNALSTTSRA